MRPKETGKKKLSFILYEWEEEEQQQLFFRFPLNSISYWNAWLLLFRREASYKHLPSFESLSTLTLCWWSSFQSLMQVWMLMLLLSKFNYTFHSLLYLPLFSLPPVMTPSKARLDWTLSWKLVLTLTFASASESHAVSSKRTIEGGKKNFKTIWSFYSLTDNHIIRCLTLHDEIMQVFSHSPSTFHIRDLRLNYRPRLHELMKRQVSHHHQLLMKWKEEEGGGGEQE